MKNIIITVAAFIMIAFHLSAQNYAMPALRKQDTVILTHKGFTISYNPQHKNANWVAYQLVGSELSKKKIERESSFKKDPLYAKTATNVDYKGSGYDKGHLFPAGSSWTETIMKESFYYTNVSPQTSLLNRGKWKEIEETVRKWAETYDTIYVVTGGILRTGLKKIGNSVSIPEHFFKLILVYKTQKKQAIVFLCENKKDCNCNAISVDELERQTGIDFCSALDKNIQKKIEEKIRLEDWNLK
ncbi:MAG: DNA/RNA non-specific endonuclease [Bacteroidales bacterium]|jgi:endonuclease G|nr:DNA/RNA non-specific endonuclease [Bacteroidales bacterium]